MAENWPIPWGKVPNNRHARHARRDLLEQLEPFPAKAWSRAVAKS
jgi:hypothetical protein